ncbi:MAG: M50 family metallopeptidase [Candidatus Woesearchaeota archaeon]|jgi:Zn-dependent protease|nr:M50 family metallopeptidase [Candidatus Woesearchaeota archaeon]|tara:strand:+ start:268 stop:852 length:585 start_codon:yes stop_codon:yes gene_type:complete
MLFTLKELFDIIMMSLIVGYIFKDLFKTPTENYDPLKQYQSNSIITENLKFAIMVTAPAIILHELAHKFAALYYGLEATFHAAYMWLGLGLILKFMNFGFIFFVPGYVSISCRTIACQITPLQSALIAGAGPFMNLLLWQISSFIIKHKKVNQKYLPLLLITSKINMFLFIFNMLPFFMFDGYKVFNGLIRTFI